MRRTGIVCAVVAASWGFAAYSLPRIPAQNAGNANWGSSAAGSVTENKPAVRPTPRVIVEDVTARGLAVNPSMAAGDSANENGSATLYLTTAETPERLFAVSVTESAAASKLAAIAGTGAAGSLGDGGPALRAEFEFKLDSPGERSGVAVAVDKTIFVADSSNSTIRRIAGNSSTEVGIIDSIAGRWGSPQAVALVEPLGLALDRNGNLYIADHGANAVFILPAANSADPQPLAILAHVASPASVAAAPDGSRILVASPETGKVFAYTAATKSLDEIQMRSAAGSPFTPAGISVDGGGNLFVADSTGNRILRRDASSGSVTAAAKLHKPGEIAFDAEGNLFVSEQGMSRVVELEHLGVPASSVTITPPAPLPPPTPPLTCPAMPNSPTAYNFCTEPQGGTTAPQQFTLTNSTVTALTSLTIDFDPAITPSDFQVISSSCTQTLAAGSTCAINVAFSPTTSGERAALLSVNYTGAANRVTSPLAGTGDDYQIAFQSAQSSTVTVVNGSAAKFNMQINPDNLFGGPVTFTCPSNMPAQTTCTVMPANPVPVTPGTAAMFTAVFQTTSRIPPPGSGGTGKRFFSGRAGRLGLALLPALLVLAIVGLWIFAKSFTWSGPGQARAIRCSIALAVFAAVGAIAAGCGNHGNTLTVGTPAGTTVMILQGAAQGAARGITVTLIVQ